MSSEPDVATAAKKRTLELEAFSSLVDALRAAGPLTPERKTLLQQTANALKISADRYKAEIRRALAKPNLSGEIDETSWAMEGRRDTFLLPRKPPRATLAVPYAAYTTRLTPALVQLPRAPYKTVETQTVAPKVAANPKLVVVSSPRSQGTHTMVYAKPAGQQRQVRVCSTQQAGTPQLPVVVSAKAQQQQTPQQQPKMMTVPTVIRSSGPVISVPVSAVSSSICNSNNGCSSSSSISSGTSSNQSCCAVSTATVKSLQQPACQQIGIGSVSHQHHHAQPQSQQTPQQCKQIVITTPNTVQAQHPHQQIVDKVNLRASPGIQQQFALQTVQVRPTVGTPVVTKVLHPNRTSELKVLQKPRLAQVRTTATSIALTTMSPTGVRLAPTLANVTNGGNKVHIHPTAANGAGESVQSVTTIKPPTKVIKSLSQWNYDDHSVMAKPAIVAPVGAATTARTISAPSYGGETILPSSSSSSYPQQSQQQQYVHHQNVQHPAPTTKIQLASTGGGTASQTRTVQIVQMSTNAQAPSTPARVPKSVRLITPSQVSGAPPSHGTSGSSSSMTNNNSNSNYSKNGSSSHHTNNNNNDNNTGSSINSTNCSKSSNVSTQGHLHGRGHHGSHPPVTTAATPMTTTTTNNQPRPCDNSLESAVSAATKVVNSNVVVQNLPYQNYQGSIYKMVPEDVIMEEEVA
ncbi:dual specificity protein kinase splA-like [Varroa destructor]|uniref:ENT domain-containing protein n=1 Tax=Varroa destructor TaxID=109461 RepID=A0A7M7JK08_VARDE|nr:dual specificity protein kinase splA-like [Varroa destructor]XP_022653116.1 dual specificity protein kinase splA-like [Varroa destructor]XP_022653125.1 dual specificity protein kinase splA-like [Varroa destructor]